MTRRLSDKAQKGSTDMKVLMQSLPDSLFDGHTDFSALKPDQKLEWLSQCVLFAWEARKTKSVASKK